MPALALSRVGARVVESGPDGGQDLAAGVWQRLEALPDPRSPRGRVYPLACLVAIALCAFTALAQAYLFMVYEFLRLVVQHEVAKDWVATTAALPQDVPATLRAMQVAQDQADELHAQLAGRVRAVLAGLPDLPAAGRQSTGDKTAAHFAQLLRRHESLEER